MWLIYFGSTKIKDTRFSIHHEFQYRDHHIVGDHNQTIVRLGMLYRASDFFVGKLGYGFIHTESEGIPNNPFLEHRFYQEGTILHKVRETTSIRHRMRFENRFIENRDYMGRFRYCLFADIPLSDTGFKEDSWYIAFYDEIFVQFAPTQEIDFFDRNRLYGAIGYKVRDNLGVQFGYMRQNVSKNSGTNHALLSFHHTIHWD